MATSLALIIILGLLSKTIFEKLKLPGLLGMLILGIIIGPHALNLINPDMMIISADFRRIALIVILLRAGLGLSVTDLKKCGRTAIKMSFIPGIIEGTLIIFVASYLLHFTLIQAGILGFIIAAVSPAVIVPLMLEFQEKKLGTNKQIPTMILASASIDDVFAITIFSTFLGLYTGTNLNIWFQIISVPLSIILGILLGGITGFILYKFFNKFTLQATNKVIILLAFAIILTSIETILENIVPIASLLGVMTLGFYLSEKDHEASLVLKNGLGYIWAFAHIFLFVLVGAEVDVTVAVDAGVYGIIIIAIGLIGRSIGVVISTVNSNLNMRERIFSVLSYTPKATVQAAIGSVPLAYGVDGGEIILAIAVLSIIITAPLGAIAITTFGKKLLVQE